MSKGLCPTCYYRMRRNNRSDEKKEKDKERARNRYHEKKRELMEVRKEYPDAAKGLTEQGIVYKDWFKRKGAVMIRINRKLVHTPFDTIGQKNEKRFDLWKRWYLENLNN